jgi:hypothetical protein
MGSGSALCSDIEQGHLSVTVDKWSRHGDASLA